MQLKRTKMIMKKITIKSLKMVSMVFILSFAIIITFEVTSRFTYARNIAASEIILRDQSIVDSSNFESENNGHELRSSALENEQPINSTNSNIIEEIINFIGKVLFELIGPAFGTFLGVFLATSDKRKKREEKEKERNEKAEEIKCLLDKELDSIQKAVKNLSETKSFDYMTPVWNVVKESNTIDLLNKEDFSNYIKKYVVITRTLNLEQRLAKKKATNCEDQEVQELEESVLAMRRYITNGFVATNNPNETK